MPKKTPRVSVLTPIYNTNPAHLREMIESILNQTFKDFEFLILNDSPDNKEIEKIVLEYAKHDKRIKYLKNEKNMGISLSRNKLLDMAKGEYLAIFDHDDISLPERLEKQVEYLDKNLEVGLVSAWSHVFGVNDFISKSPEYDRDIKIELTGHCCIVHSACMFRKSVLQENGIKYENFYSPAEDYRIFGKLMDVTHFYIIPEVLLKYRDFQDNTTTRNRQRLDYAHDLVKMEICEKHPVLASQNQDSKCKILLFGIIPLIKLKRKWFLLFGFIPLLKLK